MRRLIILTALAIASGVPAFAQNPALTAVDYARAERFLGYRTNPLVLRAGVRPTWLPDGRFWYRVTTERGSEFVLVDPARNEQAPAFDHAALAAALSAASGVAREPFRLPFNTMRFDADRGHVSFADGRRRWTCDVQGRACAPSDEAAPPPDSVVSPDGRRAAFIREFNLWVHDLTSGRDTQLTRDGAAGFGYATDNAGWIRSDRPVLLWSPDSQRIATFQHDSRGAGEMYVLRTTIGRPMLEQWKYPLPGDDTIFAIHRVIIHVDSRRVVRLRMPPDPHRSSLCDHVTCTGQLADAEWSADGSQLAFVSTSRDHTRATLRVADAGSGDVRDVIDERVPTYFEGGTNRPNWRFLPGSDEVLWFSERDNWGHLYLYDLRTGRLKNRVTRGEYTVAETLRVDERNRVVYFLGTGRESGRDPYFTHLYRVGLDGESLTLLTPEDATHDISVSPSGEFFVDSFSKPDAPPVAVLREADGSLVRTLERADISRLLAAGWKPPTPIVVKARDGVTDLYGLLYGPTTLDPSRKYPIINRIYPGPQRGSVGTRGFVPARGDAQALAELGFVVVEIDGMGTAGRSKSFHDVSFRDMGDNTLPDQVAGMNELAGRYPWIDISRAGIWGHSGGGYAAAGAMFRYPAFFKVGISQAGNHDNRNYEDDWGEKWQGLLAGGNYDNQSNVLVASNLTGKLLLMHGEADSNVPVGNTLLVVEELIKANKDFDLLILPNRGHNFANEPYVVRRRWDYFVRHLLGVEPPQAYTLGR